MFEAHNIIWEIVNILQGLNVFHFILPKVGVGGGVDVSGPINIKELLIFTFIFLTGLGIVFGVGLAFAAQKFAVKTDPKVEMVRDVLPGANCGACGFAGCQGYAEAVVSNPNVSSGLCSPGKGPVAEAIAKITGKAGGIAEPNFARILCQGGCDNSRKTFEYEGVRDCRAAALANGGGKSCDYGCLGYGTCEAVCPFDAIHMNDKDIPVVDITKCTGCRKCEIACPKKVIEVLPASKAVLVACHSKDKPAETKKNCDVGCIACGKCVKVCPFDAVAVNNNVSRIDNNRCKTCSLCVGVCPTKAIIDYIPHRSKAFVMDNCIGCQICAKVCPVNAASGDPKKKHVIDANICIGCGICTAKCPVQAIDGTFNAREVFEAAAKKKKAATA